MSIMTVCMTQVLEEARSAGVSLGIPVARMTMGSAIEGKENKRLRDVQIKHKTFRVPYAMTHERSGGRCKRLGM